MENFDRELSAPRSGSKEKDNPKALDATDGMSRSLDQASGQREKRPRSIEPESEHGEKIATTYKRTDLRFHSESKFHQGRCIYVSDNLKQSLQKDKKVSSESAMDREKRDIVTKTKLSILAKENERLFNANAELAQQRDRNLHELTTLEKEKENFRRQLAFVQDDNGLLKRRLERERSYRRRTRDLSDKVATLQGQNEYLQSKIRAHSVYGTKLNDQVHRLQDELCQSLATRKDQKPCMEKLKQEQAQNQRDQNRLLEDNRCLQCSKNDLEHAVSFLENALEETDVLRDRIEQMKMNHALEMGFALGSITPISNMDSLKQELALANGRIRELESELPSSKKTKEEFV